MINDKEDKGPLEIRNSKLGIGAGDDQKWLSMSESALLVPYSAEYLSLLARKGKLTSKKIGNTWYTTRVALEDYMKRQMVRTHVQNGNYHAVGALALDAKRDPKKLLEDDITLSQIRSYRGDTDAYINRSGLLVEAIQEEPTTDNRQPTTNGKVVRPFEGGVGFVPTPVDTARKSPVQEIEHIFERVLEKKFSTGKKSFATARVHYKSVFTNKVLVGGLVLSIISFTVLPIPIVFSFFEKSYTTLKEAVQDSNTVLGFRPGTHENEILLLDKEGNISIMGHIETEGQLRSYVADGTAPIVVDSTTKVENLNTDRVDGVSSEEFTLAFVTANGNVTTEDVVFEGSVEVGKTLLVRGATKLLSNLNVDGGVSVKGNFKSFGNAEFANVLRVLGPAYFEGVLTAQNNIEAKGDINAGGNLSVRKNVEIRGGLEVGSSVIAKGGSFRSLGVSGDFSAGGNITLGNEDDEIVISSENFTVDVNGNASFDGSVGASSLNATSLSVTNSTSTNATSTSLYASVATFGSLCLDSVCETEWPTGLTEGDVNAFIHASTTIPKTYTENIFTAGQVFGNSTTTNATTTSFFATALRATLATITSIIVDDITADALTATNSTTTNATTTSFAISSLTSGRVPFATTGGLLTDSSLFTFDSSVGRITAPYASTTAITSSGSAYFATTGGNVGIGTTSPTAKLDIYQGNILFSDPNYSATISIADRTSGASADLTIKAGSAVGGSGLSGGNLYLIGGSGYAGNNGSGSVLVQTGRNNFGASPNNAYISFSTTATGALSERMRITPTGNVFIGDTANTQTTQGLTINQGANDDEIIALKSSDVAHGVTTRTETDTFASIMKSSATDGGLLIRAFADTGNTGLILQGYAPTDSTNKTTGAFGYITLYGRKNSGTGETNPGADANLLTIRGHDTTRFIFDEEGELHLVPSSGSNTVISPSASSYFMGGNVGIGTTGPGTLLHIESNSSIPVFTVKRNQVVANGIEIGRISFDGVDDTGVAQTYAEIKTIVQGDVPGGEKGDIVFLNARDGTGVVTEAMRINFSGNVGIGTTNPSTFKLEVAGNIGPEADNTRDLGSLTRRFANIFGVNSILTNSTTTNATTTNFFSTTASSTNLFSSLLSVGGSSGLNVIAGGNVGIGTTNPGSNLHIGNGVGAQEIRIDSGNGDSSKLSFYGGAAQWGYFGVDANEEFVLQSTSATDTLNFAINSLDVQIGGASGGWKLAVKDSDLPVKFTRTLTSAGIATALQLEGIRTGAGGTAGFGTGLEFYLEGAINNDATSEAGNLAVAWSDASVGDSYMTFSTKNGGTIGERVRINNAGNVGIGETAPGSKLSVSGGGSFGAGYDTTTAPTNGLIIEGNVGIGTTSPSVKFSVGGAAGDTTGHGYFTGGLGIGVATTTSGVLETSGNAWIGGSLTVAGSLTSSITNGQIQFLANPTGTNINEGGVYINPSSAGTNNVLLGLAVGGTEKVRIDAEGDVQIIGLFNSTNTSGTNDFSGSLAVDQNTTLGDTSSDTLTVNASVSSSLIPTTDNSYDLGALAKRWANFYATSASFDSISTASSTLSAFIINSDNATADTEDATLEFERGTLTPNAVLKWNSTDDQFEFNDFTVSFAKNIVVGNTASSSIAGPLWLTGTPESTALQGATLYVNPSSASTNYSLFSLGVAGVERFRVDAEGDTTIQASLGIENTLYDITEDTLTINDDLQVNGNDIKDSSGTTRLTLGATNTITGGLNISGLTASRFVLTDASSNLISSGLSSILSDTLTDETGTGGVAVFNASPAFTTSITTGSTSFDLFNTTATTINFGGAATALNIGGATGTTTIANGLTVGGTDLVVQQATGNVGIGTAGPDYKLEVETPTTDPAYIVANGGAGAFIAALGAQNSAGVAQEAFVGTLSNDDFKIKANNTEYIRVKSTGNVGIGTTAPLDKLTVQSANAAHIFLDIFASNSVGADPVIRFGGKADATAPAVTDMDWGIGFDRSNNRLSFLYNAGGVTEAAINQLMVIDSTGNVGIGTTAPDGKLHVAGGNIVVSDDDGGLLSNTSDGADNQRIKLNGGGAFSINRGGGIVLAGNEDAETGTVSILAGNVAGGDIGLWTQNTERVHIDYDGNVGIGTTTPGAKLHIEKDTSGLFEALRILNPSAVTTAGTGANIAVGENASTKFLSLAYVNSGSTENTNEATTKPNTAYILANSGATGGLNLISRGGPTRFYAGGIAAAQMRMIIDTSGNVGIGTTGPGYKLDIIGAMAIRNTIAGVPQLHFFETDSAYTESMRILRNNDKLIFTYGWNANEEAMTITNTGNVGIGTTAPDERLTVKSSGTATNVIRVDASDGSALFDVGETAEGDAIVNIRDIAGGAKITFDASGDSFLNGGNVGIGTTGPNVRLETGISAANETTSALRVTNLNASGYGIGIDFADELSAGRVAARIASITPGDATTGELYFQTRVGSALTEKMRITSTGNVGIGTTDPKANLHVVNDIMVSGTGAPTDTANSISLYNNGANIAVIKAQGSGATTPANMIFSLEESDGGGSIQPLYLQGSTGNVGIGTTAPDEALEVKVTGVTAGTYAVTGIKIRNSADISSKNTGLSFGSPSWGDGAAIIAEDQGADGRTALVFATRGTIASGVITENMRIYNGNVGIGTTEPVAKLNVKGTVRFDNTAATPVRLQIEGGTDDFASIYADTAVAYKNLVLQRYGGNVGIGTTAPDSSLSIDSANDTRGFYLIDNDASPTVNVATIQRSNNLASPTEATALLRLKDHSSNFPLSIVDHSDNSLFVVKGNGNVGIGTTTPAATLHVGGALRLQSSFTDATNKTFRTNLGHYTNAEEPITALLMTSVSGAQKLNFGGGSSVENAATEIGFFTAANSTTLNGTERMTILSGGNVGIGTTSPASKLDVNGVVRIENSNENGCLQYNSTANQLEYSNDCTTFQGFASSTGGGWTDDGTTVRLTTSTDSVGIGTASPSSKLHVRSTTAAAEELMTLQKDAAWSGFTNALQSIKWRDGTNVVGGIGARYDGTHVNFDFHSLYNSGYQTESSVAMTIRGDGNVGIGDTTPDEAKLVVGAAGSGNIFATFATANTAGLCWDGSGASLITDCSSAPTDLAENFGTTDTTLVAGDLVVPDPTKEGTILDLEVGSTTATTSRAWVLKASNSTRKTLLGVVSTNPNQVYGDDGLFDPSENPIPITLAGRVPVNVANTSPAIAVGDAITVSSDTPGKATKATTPGMILGTALSSYDPQNPPADGKILVFIKVGWYGGEVDNSAFFDIVGYTDSKLTLGSNATTSALVNGFTAKTRVTGADVNQTVLSVFGDYDGVTDRTAPYLTVSSGSMASSTEADILVVDHSGNVGIGTSTPAWKLNIATDGAPQLALTDMSATSTAKHGLISFLNGVFSIGQGSDGTNETNGTNMASSTLFTISNSGNVGIGTTTPARQLSVSGSVGFDGLGIGFGAGSLCLSSDGEVVYNSGSDSCLPSLRETKHSITSLSQILAEQTQNNAEGATALALINELVPVSFIYNEGPQDRVRYGFIAEDSALVDKGLATYDAEGNITGVDDRALIALSIRALQELAEKNKTYETYMADAMAWQATRTNASTTSAVLAELEAVATSTATSTDGTYTTDGTNRTYSRFLELVRGALGRLGLALENGVLAVGEFVADKVSFKYAIINDLTVDALTINNKLCVDGVCLDREQLKALLQERGGVSTTTSPVNSTQQIVDSNTITEPATTTPETTTITETATTTEPVVEVVVEEVTTAEAGQTATTTEPVAEETATTEPTAPLVEPLVEEQVTEETTTTEATPVVEEVVVETAPTEEPVPVE